jgi:cell division septum initiation protein DivIVA
MNFGDDLQAIAEIALGRTSMSDPHSLCEELEQEYQRRVKDRRELQGLNDAIADSELGSAAYAVGTHYAIHGDHSMAERWLRLAAERGIGDAALQLARICERREVKSFNIALELDLDADRSSAFVPDVLSEAHYWYQRAAEEGYGSSALGLTKRPDTPLLSFACCNAGARPAAEAKAEAVVRDARAKAAEIIERAREDARLIEADARVSAKDAVDRARREYSELVSEAQLLARVMCQTYDSVPAPPGYRSFPRWVRSLLDRRRSRRASGIHGRKDLPRTLHPLDFGMHYSPGRGIVYGLSLRNDGTG